MPGSKADVSACGAGVGVTPGGRTVRLQLDADLVDASKTIVIDDHMLALIDSARR